MGLDHGRLPDFLGDYHTLDRLGGKNMVILSRQQDNQKGRTAIWKSDGITVMSGEIEKEKGSESCFQYSKI